MAIGTPVQPAASPPPSPGKRTMKIAVAAASPIGRRQPMVCKEPAELPPSRNPCFGEVAGAKTAECAAVCCCFPWGLVNLFVAVAVKLPAGLLRRALQRRRKRGKKQAGGHPAPKAGHFFVEDEDLSFQHGELLARRNHGPWKSTTPSPEFNRMEKEMLENFCNLGFWRSPSQREREEQ